MVKIFGVRADEKSSAKTPKILAGTKIVAIKEGGGN
jgi:hypothetical protein